MKKRAMLTGAVVYIIILVVAFALLFFFIGSKQEGASLWADYYAKEISRVINSADVGDSVSLDVHKATEIALKNNVGSFSEIVSFDNLENEVCVKLSLQGQTCYRYFNDVDVVMPRIELASGTNAETNLLSFEIVGVVRDE